MNQIFQLDCTFRDGGYYNNWQFSNEIVKEYLDTMSKISINFIELGFRSIKKNDFKGPNWYTTDDYLSSLKIPKNLKIGVMINCSEFISNKKDYKFLLNKIFKDKKSSRLDFIRIAAHSNEIEFTSKICDHLKSKGYLVGINLMQISEVSDLHLEKVLNTVSRCKPFVFYIADSLGCINEKEIQTKIETIKKKWNGNIGIHAHNNLGKALSNTVFAVENGVNFLDSTITGMGRGPGNAETEYLYLELQEKKVNKAKSILPLLNLQNDYFIPLKKKYNWGPNPYYYLSGKLRIHPTYVQEMLSIKLESEEMLKVLNELKFIGRKYDPNLIKSVFQKPIKENKGNWSPIKNFKGKEVLLLSHGEATQEYKFAIEKYIVEKKPIVLALNNQVSINKNLISYYVSCNPLKIISKLNFFKKMNKQIIMPMSFITSELDKKISKSNILDFGVGLMENSFKFSNYSVTIPKLYNIAYALGVATSGQASRILLAGFDGYQDGDIRNKIVDEIFFKYSHSKKSLPIISITPTIYNFKSVSVYAI
tara:strand:- start:46 stop:1650 length:1605 start_codon:yes stop_codon:yes gene_type:complete